MTRPASGYLRALERIEQAVQESLARIPEIAPTEPREAALPLPEGLRRVDEHLARLEEAVGNARVEAAGIEHLLQAEANAFSAWVESFVQVRARLENWAGNGPASP